MFKTYRITPLVFILFWLMLITISLAFAEDSPEFIACQQMIWKDGKKAKKNCFSDLIKSLVAQSQKSNVAWDNYFIAVRKINGKKYRHPMLIKLVQKLSKTLI